MSVCIRSSFFINNASQVCQGSHLFQSFAIKCSLVGALCVLSQDLAFPLVNIEAYCIGSWCYTDCVHLHLFPSIGKKDQVICEVQITELHLECPLYYVLPLRFESLRNPIRDQKNEERQDKSVLSDIGLPLEHICKPPFMHNSEIQSILVVSYN